MQRSNLRCAGIFLACLTGILASGADANAQSPLQREAVVRLAEDSLGLAEVGFADASDAVGLIQFHGGVDPDGLTEADRAEWLIEEYGPFFGSERPGEEFDLVEIRQDERGVSRYEFEQRVQGVPVFGAGITVHFDPAGNPLAMSGLALGGVHLDSQVSLLGRDAAEAIAVAETFNFLDFSPIDPLQVEGGTELLIYRVGLVLGAADGPTYRAWRVVVTGPTGTRDILFVDALTGKVIDRQPGTIEAVSRVVHDFREGGYDSEAPGDNVMRAEGDDPTGDTDVDRIYDLTGISHTLYDAAFGYDAWDGEGITMRSEAYWSSGAASCPNAVWNGTTTAFCAGVTGVDVVAHEWQHAYTESTAGLIYGYQPGALNEGFSDIFGEVVDMIVTGCDAPNYVCEPRTIREVGECVETTVSWPILTVTEPGDIAGEYAGAPAMFGPSFGDTGPVTGRLVLVSDGRGDDADACNGIDNGDALDGNIAVVTRGTCTFESKTIRAQDEGAIAVIVINNREDPPIDTMGTSGAVTATIPTLMISQADGAILLAALEDGVTATAGMPPSDESERWLVGEAGSPLGVVRDMWAPNCLGAPGAVVGDESYWCAPSDNGGVHVNSQIPTHLFAMLTDGAVFSGVSVPSIGVVKATHIHWLALAAFMGPTTGFSEYAGALSAACDELEDAGVELPDLEAGAPSGETITGSDCDAVESAIEAVGLREEVPCDYSEVLDASAPPVCSAAGGAFETVFDEDFETDPGGRWALSHFGVEPEYVETDWAWVTDLPSLRGGSAAFALDSVEIGDCRDDDQSGVVELTSPSIVLPASEGSHYLTFTHYVATEALFDGGNVRVSLDGAEFVLIDEDSFVFNAYNGTINDGDNTNPLAGEPAFTGFNEGTVTGSWGESQIDLGAYAAAGDTIQIQFRFGVDGCNGLDGWYVDDVEVGHCVSCASAADCDDGNPCTRDVCSESGSCTNTQLHPGAACGSLLDFTECDGVDTCDADGICQPNLVEAGGSCGDPTVGECSGADICDGAGLCVPNHAREGRLCGDREDTDCSAADTCDGAGVCLDNHVEPGSACGDGESSECSAPDTCDAAGACLPNHAAAGSECGAGSASECDNPDICDGAGACSAELVEDGTECVGPDACVSSSECAAGSCEPISAVDCDDGDPCTADACEEDGSCSHVDIDTPECAEPEDVGPDAGEDVGPDAGEDVGPDAGEDVGPDAAPDVGEDVRPDADAGEDVGPDVEPDADAGEPDAGDAGEPDASEPDTGEPDVGEPDAADVGVRDTGLSDVGGFGDFGEDAATEVLPFDEPETTSGCQCTSSPAERPPLLALLSLIGLVVVRRPRLP